jgi:hypothetical protein
MKILLRLFNSNSMVPQLGRWYISHVPKVVTIKVDQANMDHCGVCFIEQDGGSDDYMEPFVMY